MLTLSLLTAQSAPGASAVEAGAGEESATSDMTEASRLLERMTAAVSSLDYQGTLVYLLDNRLETLQLDHRVEDGQVQEKLVSLSGPVRALTRSRDRLSCTMADGHPISVESRKGDRLLHAERIDLAALSPHYRMQLVGTARIAGRETDVLAIAPRDALRYGYRLYLDRATGLPLKSDLIDGDGNPLEQVLFTAVTVDPASRSSPPAPGPVGMGSPSALSDATPWRFSGRPAGFEQTMHDSLRDSSGATVDRFLFSDGLSSYSIYVETEAKDGLDGTTRIGAAHAAGRRLGEHQVTAVGEVPAATVEAAVRGVTLERSAATP